MPKKKVLLNGIVTSPATFCNWFIYPLRLYQAVKVEVMTGEYQAGKSPIILMALFTTQSSCPNQFFTSEF